MSLQSILAAIIAFFSSLRLTVFCLSCLLVLVFLGTLDQVHLGIYYAQKKYFDSLFIFWQPFEFLKIPVFPGGGLLAALLITNLVVAHFTRFTWSIKKVGLWLIHVGLIILLIGLVVSRIVSVETQMAIEEGKTANYAIDERHMELAIIDTSDSAQDTVYSIPESKLDSKKTLQISGLPFSINILAYYPNSRLEMGQGQLSPATQGIGLNAHVTPQEVEVNGNNLNNVSAFIEFKAPDQPLGTWLLSNALGAPQSFTYNSKTYMIFIRPTRYYTPYTLTLKDFRHDLYPGTTVPKNFSSLVTLSDPNTREKRDALIYMNNPLRYKGKTYYQASFGKNDTLSVLQVVENPSWLLPYLSCSLIGIGLALHFLLQLLRFTRKSS